MRLRPTLLTFFFTLFFVVGGLPTAVAQRQDDKATQAWELTRKGSQLRKAKDNLGALPYFQKAYDIYPSPRTAALLGMCEYVLRRFVDSEAHLAEALASPDDSWVEGNRPALLNQMQRLKKMLGWLEITGRPVGAQIEVEGRIVGRLPLSGPIRLVAGRVFVRADHEGFHPARRAMDVKPNETSRLVVELEAMAASASTLSAGSMARSETNPLGRPPPPSEAIPMPVYRQPGSWKRSAAWVSLTVAGVLGLGGASAIFVSTNKINQFNAVDDAETQDGKCNTNQQNNGGGKCSALLQDSEAAKKIAYGAFAGAGVAGLAAAIFFATAPDAPISHAFSCGPLLSGTGATCAFTF